MLFFILRGQELLDLALLDPVTVRRRRDVLLLARMYSIDPDRDLLAPEVIPNYLLRQQGEVRVDVVLIPVLRLEDFTADFPALAAVGEFALHEASDGDVEALVVELLALVGLSGFDTAEGCVLRMFLESDCLHNSLWPPLFVQLKRGVVPLLALVREINTLNSPLVHRTLGLDARDSEFSLAALLPAVSGFPDDADGVLLAVVAWLVVLLVNHLRIV